jgi:hypothetical protein
MNRKLALAWLSVMNYELWVIGYELTYSSHNSYLIAHNPIYHDQKLLQSRPPQSAQQ